MAEYFSLADVETSLDRDVLLGLLDNDHDGAVDADLFAELRTEAQAEIDGYISRLENLTEIQARMPSTLKRLAVDVFCQFAFLRKPGLCLEKGETPVEGRYKRALTKLREIRDGDFRLDPAPTAPPPVNTSGGVYYGTSDATPYGVGGGIFKGGFGDF